MVDLARSIVVGLPVASGRARVGAIIYDSTARSQFYLSTYGRNVDAILNAFEFNRARGSTNTQEALNLARTDQVCLSYYTLPLHFRLQLSLFLVNFYNFCTIGNRNEYSTITCILLT